MTADIPHYRNITACERVAIALAKLGESIATPEISINRRGEIHITVTQPRNDEEVRCDAVRRIATELGGTAKTEKTNTVFQVRGDGVSVHTTRVERCTECGRAKA